MGYLSYPRHIEKWGYPYGLMVYHPEDSPWLCELHGPYLTREEATQKQARLSEQFAEYPFASYQIVKIETPQATEEGEKSAPDPL